jgi:AraC-like DNA-binding protein
MPPAYARSLSARLGTCYNQHEIALLYLEHTPAPPLNRFVRALWYARAPQPGHRRERILPSGNIQVLLNLADEHLHGCAEGQPEQKSPPAIVVGARSTYEIVNTADMADLIGLVFEPGQFPVFAFDAADLFSNRFVALEDIWGREARTLRDRLRDLPHPESRLRCFEQFLSQAFVGATLRPRPSHHRAVDYALRQFALGPSVATVRDVARSTGWSERRFSQVFREQVGLPPKVWFRLQRFQRAVRQLHTGVDVPWARLALDCGFYDQSHFANEFRAFSGVDITTYSTRRTLWANHIVADPMQ